MLDLSTLAAQETAEIPLVHPATRQEIPGVAVVMYGPGSAQYVQARARCQAAIIKLGASSDPDPTEADAHAVQLLVDLTLRMKGLERDGAPIDTPAQIKAIYSDPAFGWLREQADRGAVNWANFLPRASTGSPPTPASLVGDEQPRTAAKPRVLNPKA
jgi:hypothetical protein